MADRKIAFSSKLSFGVGQVAEGLKNSAFGILVLFYYNQVLEVPGSLCGLALGIALIFDALTDPLAGSLSDNWKSRLGRRHPFMYASAIPLALAFFGLFSPPELGPVGLFLWLLVFAVLTRAAMTLYHVPHIALGAELTENFEERTVIVAYRQAFGTFGGMLAVALAFGWFFADARGGRLNVSAYSPYAIVLGVLMVLTIWISAYGTQKEIPHLPVPGSRWRESGVFGRLVHEIRDAFQNASFRWLFAGVLILYLMVGVDGALNLYLYQYFWELDGQEILLLTITTPVGLILGTFFAKSLHGLFDKKPGLVIGVTGWAICQIVPVVLRLVEWFSENGTALLMWHLLGYKFFQGVIVAQSLVSFGSMMADVADEHELQSGQRQEGIFFGAVAFSGKSASGLGTIVAGVSLDLISWPRGTHIQTAADVAPQTLVQLGLLYGPIVAGFAIVSIWCFAHYKLNRARHSEILGKLQQVRQARG